MDYFRENCTGCKFFLPPQSTNAPPVCRRFPPTMGMEQEKKVWATSFVILMAPKTTWCGEYRTKLMVAGTVGN